MDDEIVDPTPTLEGDFENEKAKFVEVGETTPEMEAGGGVVAEEGEVV